jgi:uncharacterized protein
VENIYITGFGVYEAFFSGYHEILRKKDYLNSINFFPVPDGDTGTNLASTFSSIADNLRVDRSVHAIFQTMADAVMDGARGNSGIIIAQFISGLKKETSGHEKLDTRQFSRAVLKASDYTYDAVSKPEEGTILTVIKDWADALVKLSEKISNPLLLFREAHQYAKKSLEKTRYGLELNRKAGVVDAGASAFVSFLDGLNHYALEGRKPRKQKALRKLDIQHEKEAHSADSADSIENRYCVEALVESELLSGLDLKAMLKQYGDSLIIGRNGNRARIHIHTNTPADFFFTLRSIGTIKKEKVDDMVLEFRAAHEKHRDIALVTDSIADIPQEIKDKYMIHMVSQKLLWGESSYLDRVTISPETFYPHLDADASYPSSSLPEEKDIDNLFSFLSSHYKGAIVLPVGEKLSGTKALFDKATEKIETADFTVSVMDTRLNSAAQGLLVLSAAECIEEGKSMDEVTALLEEERKKIKIFVAVSTFKYMVRSGRVSPLKGLIATLLNLKPIVSLDEEGKGAAFGKAFSQKALQKKVIAMVTKMNREKPIKRFVIVHAAAEKKARSFAESIEKSIGLKPLYIMEISPVVGLHAGVGAVAVAIQYE